jgi:hypothetical protein
LVEGRKPIRRSVNRFCKKQAQTKARNRNPRKSGGTH